MAPRVGQQPAGGQRAASPSTGAPKWRTLPPKAAVSSMLRGHSAVFQALLGTLFTWGLTAAGAALVFVFSSGQRRVLDGSLGFAAGELTRVNGFMITCVAVSEQWLAAAVLEAWLFA